MEFNKKLQELRKRKGLTQEELAEKLFVSRTAVSKWESGRGYPNLDSLKQLAKLFGVTIDELLSGSELLTVAEEDNKRKENRLKDLLFGLLDISVALLFFLPFFALRIDGNIYEVSLLGLTKIENYLKTIYFLVVCLLIAWGILILALQGVSDKKWDKTKRIVSLTLSAVGVVVFIVSLQPYATVLLLMFLMVKALMLIKWK